jgi:hypothetical protein
MRFKPIKNLTKGKSKEKPQKEDDEFKAIAANRIADMEKRIHDKTKDLEKKVQEIQGLSVPSEDSESNGDIPKGPHGPLVELTLEPDDALKDDNSLTDSPDEEPEEEGEEIKLVEVRADAVAPQEKEEDVPEAEGSAAPAETAEKEKEIKPDDNGDSFNDLFSSNEEEENPLANLIKSLPDVTAGELIDDLKEIKGIIKEWQKK